jgi:signal transduction histidine kinase
MADEERLFNAFYNLVNNAVAAVPDGGTITVSGEVEQRSPGIVLSVADSGPGMPPEVCRTIFTAQAMSRKRLGSGLGMRIVKDAIDAHHGRIDVESAVGVGTTIRIFLPLGHLPAAAG